MIGLLAATLTTAAYLPQVVKVLRDKSAKDISLSMYLVMFTGVVLWLVYGLYHNSAPIIFANIITSVLTLAVIVLKLKSIKAKMSVEMLTDYFGVIFAVIFKKLLL